MADRRTAFGLSTFLVASTFLSIAAPRILAAPCLDSCVGGWRTLSPLGALSFGSVSSIVTAPDGRLFVGFDADGLAVYAPGADGVYAWTRIGASRGGLASNRIRDLAVFGDELWIATADAGISLLHLRDGSWRRFDRSNSSLPSDSVNRLTVVPPPPGAARILTNQRMWASTQAGAAQYYYACVGPVGCRWWWSVMDESDGLPGANVFDVAVQFVGNDQLTWFATNGGLVRWDGTNIVPIACCGMDTADRMIVDGQNAVWFDTLEEVPAKMGSVLVPMGLCRATRGPFGLLLWEHFEDMFGYDMSLDPAGRVWSGDWRAGMDGGWAYDRGTWCVFRKEQQTAMPSNAIAAVHAEGEICWFGHDDVPRLSGFSPNWRRYASSEVSGAGSAAAVLLSDGVPYVGFGGTSGGGVSWRPVEDGPWQHSDLEGNQAPVTALLRAGDLLWVGTDGNGIFCLDPSGSVAGHWTAAGDFPSDRVRAIAADPDGRVWAATAAGLALRGNGYWLTFTSANSPLPSDDLRALAVDEIGRIWIGTAAHGIRIRDPNASGPAAWAVQDTTHGLPSNRISAIARGAGGMWVGTDAGAAQWDPTAGGWVVHDATNGALPGDEVTSLATGGGRGAAGVVWVGTAKGLARLRAGSWTHYRVTSSLLASDRVTHLAAEGLRLLVSAGGTLCIREEIPGPIGHRPPQIASFAPKTGAPGTLVEITGSDFDDRGPDHNLVYIGTTEADSGHPAPPAEVVSATATKIVFKVPPLATSGKIRVYVHCLEAESADRFEVAPRISSLSPLCLGMGDLLTIHGAGFSGDGAAEVKIGGGAWRVPVLSPWGEQDPDRIRVRIEPGDTAGYVWIRNGNGKTAQSAEKIQIGSLSVKGVRIQQAIEGSTLVWGKRTLVHVDLGATTCKAHVSGGRLWWRKKGGTKVPACTRIYASSIAGESVPVDAPATWYDFFSGIDFVAEFNTNRSLHSEWFPLSLFDGFEIELTNNDIVILNHIVPASQAPFIEVPTVLRFHSMGVWPKVGGMHVKEFWRTAYEGMVHCARIYPQQDVQAFFGPNRWFTNTSIWMDVDSVDIGGNDDNEGEVRSRVDELLNPGDATIAVALLDVALYEPGSAEGRGPYEEFPCGTTVIGFNRPGIVGKTMAHEGGHVLGLSRGSLGNEDPDNDHHSRYDEGIDHDTKQAPPCPTASRLTFWSAVIDQKGGIKQVYKLDDGPPLRFSLLNCGEPRAKSLMSYAPDRMNTNAFFEPVEYEHVLGRILWFASYGKGTALEGQGALAASRTLRLRGRRGPSGGISVSISYLDESQGDLTRSVPGGAYALRLLAGDGSVLLEHPFSIASRSGEGGLGFATFHLAVPFPDAAASAEIRKGGTLLWSRRVSRNAPRVEFLSPAGGTYPATGTVPVAWRASDPDGDALQFALDYSPDGGSTWEPIAHYLTGQSFAWKPGFVISSAKALLRIRASDGFLTATAISAPFAILPHPPYVFIVEPKDGSVFTEGSLVDVSAHSMTSEGTGGGIFEWSVDGRALRGQSRTLHYRFDLAGTHVIRAKVRAGSLEDSDEVTVTILPDYDRDGIPNDWELGHRLDPLDLEDAKMDPDGDGLTNYGEYAFGTNPWARDTDGDGTPDGEEIAAGTSPLDPSQEPELLPVLRVGSASIAFEGARGGPSPDPRGIWVTNAGSGLLSWTAARDVPWLEVTPTAGQAPSNVLIGVRTENLAVGTYEGKVTFAAAGALESPQVLRVTLRIVEAPVEPERLFIRGDSNASLGVDIADPIFTLNYLFARGLAPSCLDAADANDDGQTNIADAVYTLNSLFANGPSPPRPYPGCGSDPTPDRLGCAFYPVCR